MKDSTMERRSFFKYGATATVASGQLDRPIAARAGQKGTKMSKALQF